MGDKTFLRITNKDIYEEIKKLKKENIEAHEKIIEHQIETNGKVKLNKWISTTAMTLAILAIGYVINHAYNTFR